MPSDEERQAALEAAEVTAAKAKVLADSLSSTLEAISGRLKEKASKKLVRWMIVSVALDVILSVVTIILSLGVVNAQHKSNDTASTLRQQSITNCQNNNRFRLAQVQSWESYFALQADEGKSTAVLLNSLISTIAKNDPAEITRIDAILTQSGKANAAETATFLKVVKAKDAPKNCQALYGNG
jgi:hypothetical protein